MDYDLDAFDNGLFDEVRSIMKQRFPDMVDGYLEDSVMYIEKIKEGLDAGDKALVSDYAHPLKSSSEGLGIMSVALIAKDIEYGAKDAIENGSDISHLKNLVEPIEEALRRAETKLKSEM